MRKAIIFGVTGQDGSHLADLLIFKDYEVVGVSRRCSVDNTERIQHLLEHDRFQLVSGDITDVSSVIRILKDNDNVDEVYNLAAQSHVGVSFKQPGLTWDVTGKGCLNILQSIVDLDLQCRFYQASSSEMFGRSYDEYENGEKYQNEDTKFLPQSPYAIAKAAAHHLVRVFREGYGVHGSCGILFNHEGERRGENFVTRKITKWVSKFHRWAEERGLDLDMSHYDFDEDYIYAGDRKLDEVAYAKFPKLRLGNLDAHRDWGYAGDYVEAMWVMLQQDEPDDYVICTGATNTIREFLDLAFRYVNAEDWENFVVIDPEFYRPSEVDYLRGDASKAKDKLRWEPKYTLRHLVQIMMEHDLHENLQNTS
jgi:GDPmannose 4,6-dehydratase|tara:strand:- start:5200 stop:6297 length:1098 start_codon:yes stop_codon:yes gene_type:complete